jgi:hypothetical protein
LQDGIIFDKPYGGGVQITHPLGWIAQGQIPRYKARHGAEQARPGLQTDDCRESFQRRLLLVQVLPIPNQTLPLQTLPSQTLPSRPLPSQGSACIAHPGGNAIDSQQGPTQKFSLAVARSRHAHAGLGFTLAQALEQGDLQESQGNDGAIAQLD